MQMIVETLFFFTILKIVPKHGPIKGSQYLTNTIEAFLSRIILPILNQFNGLIELMEMFMVKSFGAGVLLYCDLPGNIKEGY